MNLQKAAVLFQRGAKSSLLQNIFFSGFVQAINMLTPIVVAPYLTHAIGLEKFGIVNFVWAFTNVMFVFIDFGFNLTAVRRGSLLRNKKNGLSYLFSRVITLRLLLSFCCILVLIGLTFTLEKAIAEQPLFLSGIVVLLGYALNSFWFFQSIEQMKIISLLNVLSKIIFIVSLLVIVTAPQDYIYVLILMGLGNFLAGIIGIIIIIHQHKIHYQLPSLYSIQNELKEGWWILASNFSISVYVNAATIFIGLFLNDTILGCYSVVEKITLGIRQITGAVHNAIYPRICLLVAKKDFSQNVIYRKIYFPYLGVLALLLLGVFWLREPIILFFVNGQEVEFTVYLLKLMIPLPLIVALNGMSYLNLLANKQTEKVSYILITAAVLNIIINYFLIQLFGIEGIVMGVFIIEFFVTFALLYLTEIKYKYLSILKNE
jgi:PST family polysaccharide transporter